MDSSKSIAEASLLFACSVALPLSIRKWRSASGPGRLAESPPAACFKPCYVSAPGKVLIAGGYLVLERENIGITIATNARFFVRTESRVTRTPDEATAPAAAGPPRAPLSQESKVLFEFVSPQFRKTSVYSFDFDSCATVLLSGDENIFVFRSLQVCGLFARGLLGPDAARALAASCPAEGVRVVLAADNDFYSQIEELERRHLPLLSSSLLELPKFLPCPLGDDGSVRVSKTGLGSSAAMTTALCGALLHTMGCVDLLATNDRPRIDEHYRKIHNVAQLAHAIAQGKVGSGFDVSSAVYGTQIYQRFDPENINRAFDMLNVLDSTPGSDATIAKQVFDFLVDRSVWTEQRARFQLPPGLDIVLGDVCGGSSSSSMAKAVLSWRKSSPVEANGIWSNLAAANKAISSIFDQLSALASRNPGDFRLAQGLCASNTSTTWHLLAENEDLTDLERETIRILCDLKKQFGISRAMLREMGIRAGVEIEPPQQTALCDASEALPGVLCAGVPGAGGVDAIFAITLGAAARAEVEAMWSRWGGAHKSCKVCPLVLSADKSPVCGVKIEV